MVRDHGRAEAMASTTARGSSRARAIVDGSMMDSGAEGTTRRRGRGGRGGGARMQGAIGVFALGALVKGAFGTSDYTNYVRVRSESEKRACVDSTSRLTNHFVSQIFVRSRENSRWRSTEKD